MDFNKLQCNNVHIMKVIHSKVLGFCMGVQRAVALAQADAEKAGLSGGRVYTLGPLIHNPCVLDTLKKSGVEVLEKNFMPNNLENCSIIICAHGTKPEIEEEIRGRGGRIVDATCPWVKTSQLKAEELSRAGYCLFLAGEAEHAEIQGILGFTGGKYCSVVSDAAGAGAAAKKLLGRGKDAENKQLLTALIGQTTISEEKYRAIGDAIKKYFPSLEIIQTICSATKERQQALRELLTQVDAVLVVGGKDSANTRSLLAIAKESGKPCKLVESAADIPESFFQFGCVGLSSGASTPDSVIDEIEKKLLR
jgi:4-hydroxy-3-methylbut-2-enyl diphosphate reductase